MTIEAEGSEHVVEETTAADTANADHSADAEQTADESDDVIVTIGEAPTPEVEETDDVDAPRWVSDLRKQNREVVRENRKLRQQIEAASKPAPPVVVVLGPKPTLRDDDVDYDEDKYDAKVTEWRKAKTKADEDNASAKANADREHGLWQAKNKQFVDDAAKLKAPDFVDALDSVTSTLDSRRQGVLLKVATQPHLVVLALGRQPDELKKLASIKDEHEFAVAVSKLEGQIKVSSRKPPPPERVPASAGRAPGGSDKTLDALERDADKSGDRSKVIAHKLQKREQERQKSR